MYTFNNREADELNEIYKELFNDNPDLFEKLKDKRISGIRTKMIKSGDYLELELYPLFNNRSTITEMRKKKNEQKETRAVQKKLNKKNSKKHLIRLVNANFKEGDIYATFTYDEVYYPGTVEAANKIFKNYVRKLIYWHKKKTGQALKYVYTTETGEKGRVHHHILCDYVSRDEMEKLWQYGGRPQTRRLVPDEYGFAGVASYIAKPRKSKEPDAILPVDICKKYVVSKNLKKPAVSIADKKFTKRQLEKIIQNDEVREFFNKKIKNYKVADFYSFFSDMISGAYLYVRLYKLQNRQKK